MKDLITLLGWSEPIPWPQERPPHAKPEGLKPRTWVRSDLIVRPEKTEAAQRLARPAYMSDHIWQAQDGESFLLKCPDAIATHMVASYYRIWAGELSKDYEDEDRLDIDAPTREELLQLLAYALEDGSHGKV